MKMRLHGKPAPVLAAVLWLLCAGTVPQAGASEPVEALRLTEAAPRGRGPAFESEHRPVPVRKYRLVSRGPLGQTEAFVRHPDGGVSEARLSREKGSVFVSFPTPFGDGPRHGVHNLYVVDRRVESGRLVVRTAKWHTVHHSCGWGHDHKYDPARTRPQTVAETPLEISCGQLWDGNFHAAVRSGDTLRFRVLFNGKPAAGAEIRMTSGKGWTLRAVTDAEGQASFQLIRDYYPDRWQEFHSRHRERFTVVAETEVTETGNFQGKDYRSVRYVASLPWTYRPSRSDYTSNALGLGVGFAAMALAVVGVFVHRARRERPYREIRFRETD